MAEGSSPRAEGSSPRAEGSSQLYEYDDVDPEALALYRRGWSEILERGRWIEAERLYRAALDRDPDFVIAKSVLARMTTDAEERKALVDDIHRSKHRVDVWGRLILDPYALTLTLITARETGEVLPDNFRGDLTSLAIGNYGKFLHRYPDEWAVRIEYLEWIHARHGPAKALGVLRQMADEDPDYVARLSYFPAYFHAQLGDYAQALKTAEAFIGELGPGDWPQAQYIQAFIAYERGDYIAASEFINAALRFDPKHIIAQRLEVKIDEALANQ